MKTPIRTVVVVCALVAALAGQTAPDVRLRWAQVEGVSLQVQKTCGHYEFAAAVQAIAAKSGVAMSQQEIVQRVYKNTECGPVGDPATLAASLAGDFNLDDGTRVLASATYDAGGPRGPDAIVRPLLGGTPYLLFWKKRPMLVVAAAWNLLSQGGTWPAVGSEAYPAVQVIRMLDPKTGGTRDFTRGVDNLGELRGTMQVTIARR
jgi:hypothetical protein